ncbi:hypothetical protein Pmani_017371 [Petrolisthes manimaculis]|uniref:Myb/SANT-like DNA-binding domain-containing protein n=1 Tax=Petrolisthes manimaculis TaxID=1843537 RepID=A0AAE1PMR3_9EUCA|nr:hypothetical protein Pmani_017371 [Petrolisthes manimaculis]
MASEAAMFQCSICDKLYLLEYEAHMCLSTHYEQEEDADGSVVLVQPDQDIPQRYSCGHCRVVYDTQERASMCLARHAAQDTWMESEACASGSSSAIETHTPASQKATTSQSHSQRQTPWTEETVIILIQAVHNAYPRLDGKQERRDRVWRDIYHVISPQPSHKDSLSIGIPGVTIDQCKTKWKNLRYTFFRYVQNMNTTGGAKLHVPQGYEQLCAFLGDRPIAKPITVSCGLEHLNVEGDQSVVDPIPGPSGISAIPPAEPSDPDDPPPAISIPEVRKSVKRKKIRPPSQSQRLEGIQRESVEEVRASGKRIDVFVTKYEEWCEQQKKFMEEIIENQRQFLRMEERKTEILEQLLKLEREKK